MKVTYERPPAELQERITLRLPASLLVRLQKAARRAGVSLSEHIRERLDG